jgi:hypothetical protein
MEAKLLWGWLGGMSTGACLSAAAQHNYWMTGVFFLHAAFFLFVGMGLYQRRK